MTYYIPDKSEFSIGFNFQICVNYREDKWEDRVYTGEDFSSLLPILNIGLIRVKELNDTDIRYLGWIPTGEDRVYKLKDYYLYNIINLIIYTKINKVYNRTFFEGRVRNIDELSRIMKMLDIYEKINVKGR